MTKTLTTPAQRIHAERFRSGTPRSDAYKAGFMAALRKWLEGVPVAMPQAWGTAEADAFIAGKDAGYAHLEYLASMGDPLDRADLNLIGGAS